MDMEEKNEQIIETADDLREDIRRVEQEQRKTFCKGIALGVLTTLVVGLLVFFVIPETQIRRADIQAQQAAQEDDSKLLSQSVENKIERLANVIDRFYYEDVDDEDLVEGLYKGLLEGIGDPYTEYYTAEEYQEMILSAKAAVCGIGALLQQDPETKQVTVVHVYEDSPAEKAGILDGDMLVQVDDIRAGSMELSDLVTHIHGSQGSVVHLKIYRKGESGYLELDVTRDIVNVPTLKGQMLDYGIGYIMIA